ncbi:hypothetical protein MTQ01_12130 [Streptomyces sp. XM4193]|uniref:hypothetical protein n=1 Tax=Streptomyces sp. XM4193 TaxID=2929782 RepID=UPI001FF9B9A3|nr:hypothetical protein [Streptomyces sp. XM4193]MCK1796751.1 hypothetical protein [Streptomyces sp. XM4193]
MRQRGPLTVSFTLLTLSVVCALAACGAAGDTSETRPSPRQEPSGDVQVGDSRTPDLPDGWVGALREYAECLKKNGARGVEVDEEQGGLDLGAQLPPEAVETCREHNPVYQER